MFLCVHNSKSKSEWFLFFAKTNDFPMQSAKSKVHNNVVVAFCRLLCVAIRAGFNIFYIENIRTYYCYLSTISDLHKIYNLI